MTEEQKWGVGSKADAKPFDTAFVGKTKVDLISGEHPHSRRDNNQYARYPDGEILEFSGHRTLIGVVIESNNYLKESEYSSDEIRKGGMAQIFADGEQVYEFFHRDLQWALLKAHNLIGELSEHPSNWLKKSERERLVGQKIFYRDIPAIISRLVVDQGAVIISTANGKPFPPPVYAGKPARL